MEASGVPMADDGPVTKQVLLPLLLGAVSLLLVCVIGFVSWFGLRLEGQARDLERTVNSLNITVSNLQVFLDQRVKLRDIQIEAIENRLERLEPRRR